MSPTTYAIVHPRGDRDEAHACDVAGNPSSREHDEDLDDVAAALAFAREGAS